MGDWSLMPSGQVVSLPGYGSVTTGNNVKGDWTQVLAATISDTIGMIVVIAGTGNVSQYLIDIGIGAEGSESVVVSNIPISAVHYRYHACFFIPIRIPSGSRIAARGAGNVAATTVNINLVPIYGVGASQAFTVFDTYGADTSDSGGTSVDPGGTASQWGSWTIIGTSLGVRQLLIGITGYDSARANATWLLELGIGAPGSEVAIMSYIYLGTYTTSDIVTPNFIGFFPIEIPAGSVISARLYCSINTAGDRLLDVVLIGAR